MAFVLSACSGVGFTCEKPSSERRPRSQIILEHATNMTWYSASANDLETKSCFLHFLKIGASPKNINWLVVDFCVSGHPTLPESLYT